MTITKEKEVTLISTDYVGKRYPQEVGDTVIVELHGKKYETEVIKHVFIEGTFYAGHIEYKVINNDWKKVNLN